MEQQFRYKVEVGPHDNLKPLFKTDSVNTLVGEIKEYTKLKFERTYYWRILDYGTYVWIDYGSWTDFVYVYFIDEEAKKEFMELKIEL